MIKIKPEWKKQSNRWGHSFHSICSYMAMFPATIPHYFIERFTEKGELVFDPFCGRGTTPLQACAEGRMGIGNDLNPLAYYLTKAKVNAPTKKEKNKDIIKMSKELEEINKRIYSIKIKNKEAQILISKREILEQKIDSLVFDLYGLTGEEIKIVKEAIN